MWISIRARGCDLSPRRRAALERLVRRTLDRARDRIASIVVYLKPAHAHGGDSEYAARIVIWSSSLGQIAASEVGIGMRSAVGEATRRVRRVLRERAKRQRKYGRLARHFASIGQTQDDLLRQ